MCVGGRDCVCVGGGGHRAHRGARRRILSHAELMSQAAASMGAGTVQVVTGGPRARSVGASARDVRRNSKVRPQTGVPRPARR